MSLYQNRNRLAMEASQEYEGVMPLLAAKMRSPFAPAAKPPNPNTSFMTLLPLDRREHNIHYVDKQLMRLALGGICTWLSMLAFVYTCTPKGVTFERLTGLEHFASFLAFVLLLVSNVARILPLVYRQRRGALSGVMIGSVAVQFIAMSSDALMAFAPSPTIIDPYTGGRVHLIRWCAWTPVAFMMTFLTEAVDLSNLHIAILHATCQSLSTWCGMLFPFCPTYTHWLVLMIIACILFFALHVRIYYKFKILRSTPRGSNVDEMELYDRKRLSFRLLMACATVWTVLVGLHFCNFILPKYYEFFRIRSLPMLTECSCDVASKILYLMIVLDVHDAVYNEGARAERRLEELRHMMSAVWESSSDVIAISIRSESTGYATTMVSPTYMKLQKALMKESYNALLEENPNALVFQLTAVDLSKPVTIHDLTHEKKSSAASVSSSTSMREKITPNFVHMVKLDRVFTDNSSTHQGISKDSDSISLSTATSKLMPAPESAMPVVNAMAELLVCAWQKKEKEAVMLHDFKHRHQSDNDNDDDNSNDSDFMAERRPEEDQVRVRCEAKVTRVEENALVVVVRDISERFKRFEAEKRVAMETTARQKDAEANRFTRHEVKNGLLAAIGLCDSLREAFLGDEDAPSRRGSTAETQPLEENSGDDEDNDDKPNDSRDSITIKLNSSAAEILTQASNAWQKRLPDGSQQVVTFDVKRCMIELDSTLREVLDTILAQSMARDVIHEVYQPRLERVDIRSVLYGVRGKCSPRHERFPLITFPSPLPPLLLDPQLLRFIHRNAVTNACKYGQRSGIVLTEIRFNSSKNELQMDVINLPGEDHEDILQMGEAAVTAVFTPGKRLHPMFSNKNNNSLTGSASALDLQGMSHSSGDGAWIMQKCAKTLGGNCTIIFEPTRTVFNFSCPAMPVDRSGNFLHDNVEQFRLPSNICGIAIDDSKIQRKMLDRFMSLLGISASKRMVLGRNVDEIKGFHISVIKKMRENPNDYFLVIVDENLDIVVDTARHNTISGSRCVEKIRAALHPDEERKLLALVRSANDSADEIALYSRRAHGFLAKAPIQKERVLEVIAPAWKKRFGNTTPSTTSVTATTTIASGDDSGSEFTNYDDNEEFVSSADIMQTVQVIDALCIQGDPSGLPERWPVLWDKLHVLKGDLKTMKDNMRVIAISEAINRLRGPELPDDFLNKWSLIRSLVMSFI